MLKLGQKELENAIVGGVILGGGGGGDPAKGRKHAQVAVQYCDLFLHNIENFPDESVVITASLVGAPKAPEQYATSKDYVRAVELFQNTYDKPGAPIAGIITNENGGEATVNGWLQSAILGIPLIDAPCNGRAHPTGTMGSMNLHKNPGYITMQTAVGGNPQTGRYLECVLRGTVGYTTPLVRQASVEAGGMVVVARNPVSIAHAKANNAIGGIAHAISVGEAFYSGLAVSSEKAVSAVMERLGGQVLAKGTVRDIEIRGEGGFDVGFAMVDDMELTLWNEYMTLDKGGERLGTFPDLIMTFDAKSGQPLPSSVLAQGMEIFITLAPAANLKLSSTMFEADLIEDCESIVGKELVRYMRKKN